MELQPGGIVSHYRIVEKLGADGMGVVYKAEDTRLGRFVALKFLPSEFARDPQALERFKREARAASALDNPNICTIHDIDEHEGQPFIVMQLLDGRTLAEKISDKPLKLAELIDIGIQIADGLAAAHAHGIVHRDIKPANIVVTKSGQAKILDFGLAKAATPGNADLSEAPTINAEALTNHGTAVGTVAYMSPEQARGADVDARTDLFSFGAVLYEMATGRQAFTGPTTAVVFDSILRGPTPSATQRNPEVPRNFDEIIARSLEKDPRLRYQTASDMKADLRRALRDTTETIRTAGIERDANSPPVSASRGKKVIVAFGLFGLALFLVLELSLYFLRGSTRPIDSLAVLPFINGSVDPDTEYLSEGISESIMNSLSQLASLRVMSSNSVSRYRGPSTDARTAGMELGVRAVLTGRVLLRGDDLSVRTELVNVQDNRRLWGEQYNRKRADILAVQEDIAKQISSALRLRLSADQGTLLAKRDTENPEAYDLYLKGMYESDKLTTGGLGRAREYFDQAIALDPKYARAYAGLAWYYFGVGDWLLPMPGSGPKAMEAARQAVRIDDSLDDAHAVLGAGYLWYEFKWTEAEKEIRRALQLNPKSWRTRELNVFFLSGLRRFDDAIAEARMLTQSDPLSATNGTTLGVALFWAKRYDEAVDTLQNALRLDPTNWETYSLLGQVYLKKQAFSDAIAQFKKARELEDTISEPLAFLGRAYALDGNKSEAQKVLQQLEARARQRHVSNYLLAIVYDALGDKDKALALLEKAYQDHSFYISAANAAPELDDLRSEPRFQKLLASLAFPH